MRFRRPRSEDVAAVLGVDHVVRVRHVLPHAQVLAEVGVGVVAVPAVGVGTAQRPFAGRPLVGAELERVEVVLARRVVEDVDDRQRQVRRAQVEARNRRPVVAVAADAVGTRIRDRHRHVEGADRAVDVVLLRQLIDPPPDQAGVDPEVGHQLVFDPAGHFARPRILQVRVELGAADAAGQRRGRGALLARLPHLVVVRVDPVEPPVPVDGVGVHQFVDRARARVPPVECGVRLQDGLAVAPEVVGHADPRRRQIPGEHVVICRERRLHRIERAGRRADLFRQVRPVPVEPGAERECHAGSGAPRIGEVGAVGPQPVERRGRRQEEQHFGGSAAAQHVQHVARHVADAVLAAQVVEPLVEDLAADLEVVAAAPPVLEIAERPEHLVARRDVEPAVAIAAADDVGRQVGVGRGLRVARVRPQVVELAAADLEERAVADDAVPLTLVGVRPIVLVPGRVGARVDGGGRRDEERVEAVRLRLLAPRAVANQLVVGGDRVGPLHGDVLQVRLEGLDREIRQQRLDLLIAQRAVPPDLVLLQEAADVAIQVVVAVQAIQIGFGEPAAGFQAELDLIRVDVARLDVFAFVVRVDLAVIGVAAGLGNEL